MMMKVMKVSLYLRCLSCVGSFWTCNWCPLDQICTHNHSCPRKLVLHHNVRHLSVHLTVHLSVHLTVLISLQDSPGPGSCPLVSSLRGSALVPMGLSTTIVLEGRNLDIYQVSPFKTFRSKLIRTRSAPQQIRTLRSGSGSVGTVRSNLHGNQD